MAREDYHPLGKMEAWIQNSRRGHTSQAPQQAVETGSKPTSLGSKTNAELIIASLNT